MCHDQTHKTECGNENFTSKFHDRKHWMANLKDSDAIEPAGISKSVMVGLDQGKGATNLIPVAAYDEHWDAMTIDEGTSRVLER